MCWNHGRSAKGCHTGKKGLPLKPFSCARSCSHFISKHSKDALVTTTCCGALIERVPTSSFRASRIGYAYSTHHCLTLVFTIFMPKGLFITPNHTHTHTRCNCHRYCDLGLGLYSVIQGLKSLLESLSHSYPVPVIGLDLTFHLLYTAISPVLSLYFLLTFTF